MELKIIEPIREYLKEFDSVDDFNKFYFKHKSDIDGQTTHQLNKKFHIKGYRLTKIHGELQIKKVSEKASSIDGGRPISLSDMDDRIHKLESLVTQLVERYNAVFSNLPPEDG